MPDIIDLGVGVEVTDMDQITKLVGNMSTLIDAGRKLTEGFLQNEQQGEKAASAFINMEVATKKLADAVESAREKQQAWTAILDAGGAATDEGKAALKAYGAATLAVEQRLSSAFTANKRWNDALESSAIITLAAGDATNTLASELTKAQSAVTSAATSYRAASDTARHLADAQRTLASANSELAVTEERLVKLKGEVATRNPDGGNLAQTKELNSLYEKQASLLNAVSAAEREASRASITSLAESSRVTRGPAAVQAAVRSGSATADYLAEQEALSRVTDAQNTLTRSIKEASIVEKSYQTEMKISGSVGVETANQRVEYLGKVSAAQRQVIELERQAAAATANNQESNYRRAYQASYATTTEGQVSTVAKTLETNYGSSLEETRQLTVATDNLTAAYRNRDEALKSLLAAQNASASGDAAVALKAQTVADAETRAREATVLAAQARQQHNAALVDERTRTAAPAASAVSTIESSVATYTSLRGKTLELAQADNELASRTSALEAAIKAQAAAEEALITIRDRDKASTDAVTEAENRLAAAKERTVEASTRVALAAQKQEQVTNPPPTKNGEGTFGALSDFFRYQVMYMAGYAVMNKVIGSMKEAQNLSIATSSFAGGLGTTPDVAQAYLDTYHQTIQSGQSAASASQLLQATYIPATYNPNGAGNTRTDAGRATIQENTAIVQEATNLQTVLGAASAAKSGTTLDLGNIDPTAPATAMSIIYSYYKNSKDLQGTSVQAAHQIASSLAASTVSSSFEMPDIATAAPKFLASGKGIGLSWQDQLAMFSSLSQAFNGNPLQAGQDLNNLFTTMKNPSRQGRVIASQLGLNINADSTGNLITREDSNPDVKSGKITAGQAALQDIYRATYDTSVPEKQARAEQATLLSRMFNATSANALTDIYQNPLWKAQFSATNNTSTKSYDDLLRQQAQNPGVQLAKEQQKLSDSLEQFSNDLLAPETKIVQGLGTIANAFSSFTNQIGKGPGAVAGYIGNAVHGFTTQTGSTPLVADAALATAAALFIKKLVPDTKSLIKGAADSAFATSVQEFGVWVMKLNGTPTLPGGAVPATAGAVGVGATATKVAGLRVSTPGAAAADVTSATARAVDTAASGSKFAANAEATAKAALANAADESAWAAAGGKIAGVAGKLSPILNVAAKVAVPLSIISGIFSGVQIATGDPTANANYEANRNAQLGDPNSIGDLIRKRQGLPALAQVQAQAKVARDAEQAQAQTQESFISQKHLSTLQPLSTYAQPLAPGEFNIPNLAQPGARTAPPPSIVNRQSWQTAQDLKIQKMADISGTQNRGGKQAVTDAITALQTAVKTGDQTQFSNAMNQYNIVIAWAAQNHIITPDEYNNYQAQANNYVYNFSKSGAVTYRKTQAYSNLQSDISFDVASGDLTGAAAATAKANAYLLANQGSSTTPGLHTKGADLIKQQIANTRTSADPMLQDAVIAIQDSMRNDTPEQAFADAKRLDALYFTKKFPIKGRDGKTVQYTQAQLDGMSPKAQDQTRRSDYEAAYQVQAADLANQMNVAQTTYNPAAQRSVFNQQIKAAQDDFKSGTMSKQQEQSVVDTARAGIAKLDMDAANIHLQAAQTMSQFADQYSGSVAQQKSAFNDYIAAQSAVFRTTDKNNPAQRKLDDAIQAGEIAQHRSVLAQQAVSATSAAASYYSNLGDIGQANWMLYKKNQAEQSDPGVRALQKKIDKAVTDAQIANNNIRPLVDQTTLAQASGNAAAIAQADTKYAAVRAADPHKYGISATDAAAGVTKATVETQNSAANDAGAKQSFYSSIGNLQVAAKFEAIKVAADLLNPSISAATKQVEQWQLAIDKANAALKPQIDAQTRAQASGNQEAIASTDMTLARARLASAQQDPTHHNLVSAEAEVTKATVETQNVKASQAGTAESYYRNTGDLATADQFLKVKIAADSLNPSIDAATLKFERLAAAVTEANDKLQGQINAQTMAQASGNAAAIASADMRLAQSRLAIARQTGVGVVAAQAGVVRSQVEVQNVNANQAQTAASYYASIGDVGLSSKFLRAKLAADLLNSSIDPVTKQFEKLTTAAQIAVNGLKPLTDAVSLAQSTGNQASIARADMALAQKEAQDPTKYGLSSVQAQVNLNKASVETQNVASSEAQTAGSYYQSIGNNQLADKYLREKLAADMLNSSIDPVTKQFESLTTAAQLAVSALKPLTDAITLAQASGNQASIAAADLALARKEMQDPTKYGISPVQAQANLTKATVETQNVKASQAQTAVSYYEGSGQAPMANSYLKAKLAADLANPSIDAVTKKFESLTIAAEMAKNALQPLTDKLAMAQANGTPMDVAQAQMALAQKEAQDPKKYNLSPGQANAAVAGAQKAEDQATLGDMQQMLANAQQTAQQRPGDSGAQAAVVSILQQIYNYEVANQKALGLTGAQVTSAGLAVTGGQQAQTGIDDSNRTQAASIALQTASRTMDVGGMMSASSELYNATVQAAQDAGQTGQALQNTIASASLTQQQTLDQIAQNTESMAQEGMTLAGPHGTHLGDPAAMAAAGAQYASAVARDPKNAHNPLAAQVAQQQVQDSVDSAQAGIVNRSIKDVQNNMQIDQLTGNRGAYNAQFDQLISIEQANMGILGLLPSDIALQQAQHMKETFGNMLSGPQLINASHQAMGDALAGYGKSVASLANPAAVSGQAELIRSLQRTIEQQAQQIAILEGIASSAAISSTTQKQTLGVLQGMSATGAPNPPSSSSNGVSRTQGLGG